MICAERFGHKHCSQRESGSLLCFFENINISLSVHFSEHVVWSFPGVPGPFAQWCKPYSPSGSWLRGRRRGPVDFCLAFLFLGPERHVTLERFIFLHQSKAHHSSLAVPSRTWEKNRERDCDRMTPQAKHPLPSFNVSTAADLRPITTACKLLSVT